MDRDNHYEVAFEGYLRAKKLGYIPVNESRRVELDAEPVKSLDFIVMTPDSRRLLIDVKGRRFPGGPKQKPRKVWENWSMREDVQGLLRWAKQLGPDTVPLFVFVYRIMPTVRLPEDVPDLWEFRDRRYLLRAVEVGAYQERMRTRSPRWDTVSLKRDDFRAVVKTFSEFARPVVEAQG